MAYSLNIIGAGKLGKTIGYLLLKHKLVQMAGVVNASKGSSEQAISFLGSGTYYSQINDLPPADISLISTSDDLISQSCELLSKNPSLKPGSLILHCSGSLSSDALISVKERGCYTASIHPMRSFAEAKLSILEYPGTYCALEGDAQAIPLVRSLFESIGSIVYTLDKSKKALYHAAGVFASNYLTTLSQQALTCLKTANIEEEMAMMVIINLMQGSINNLKTSLSPQKSLTGPIQRAETATIEKHMSALRDMEQQSLYAALGKATLELCNHSTEQKEKILKSLEKR